MTVIDCHGVQSDIVSAVHSNYSSRGTTPDHGAQKQELADYIKKKKSEVNPRYRPHYHVAPPVGWMNDPNGFAYYKGQFHIFYQYYPYDSKWGPMHWGHSSGPNLVMWDEQPTALIPDDEQIFSGSAVTDGSTMVLMYTGHVIATAPAYNESQYLAYSNDGVNFTKYELNPVLTLNTSPDFRDPKVWKHGNYWYVVLGTKTADRQNGKVVLYRSTNLRSWEYLSVIGESSNGTIGYMWECPDFFELDGRYVLLMSPQGMKPQGDRYKNTFQTGFILGNFSYDTFEFTPETEFQEIDYGHDFYATQTMDHDGRRYVIGWFGMWEVPHPEDVDGWAGMMTIVRELKIVGDRVLMQPIEAMMSLRVNTVLVGYFNKSEVLEFDTTAEIIIEGDLKLKIDLLIEGKNGGDYNQTHVTWNPADGKVAVKRGTDDVRQVEWAPSGSEQMRLFLDASSLELFCGEGEVVFSSRLFVDGPWKVTNLSPQALKIESYHLKRSVPPTNGSVVSSSLNKFLSWLFIGLFYMYLVLLPCYV